MVGQGGTEWLEDDGRWAAGGFERWNAVVSGSVGGAVTQGKYHDA
jgi:hypothetical protein